MSALMSKNIILQAVLLMLCSGMVSAQQAEHRRTVTVGGEGVVRIVPDMALVRFGIVTRDDDAEKARAMNDAAGSRTLNAVRSLGIPEQKIRLEVLQLQELYEYNPERRTQEPAGFEAVRHVVVELADLDLLPTLVARISQQGANRLFGITYDVKNKEAAQNEALRKAVLNARSKAQVIAETLGVSIGRVERISEEIFVFPEPLFARGRTMDADMETASPVPEAYSAGEIEVRAKVQAQFLIE